MSESRSPSTGKRYGIQRVCSVLGLSRSSFYARRQRAAVPSSQQGRRGPKPFWSDETVLEWIRDDLAQSTFQGEGHRKVWARLRYGQGIVVSRKRVLRLMREHNLLSPYRRPPGETNGHDGTIVTQAANVMWGTDGTKVFTYDEGYAWIFVAIEHWNAECMGWHVCKKGDRFAALEPVAQGVLQQFGSVERSAARGLALRMDHGPQYMDDIAITPLNSLPYEEASRLLGLPEMVLPTPVPTPTEAIHAEWPRMWVKVSDRGPTARTDHTMVYDSARQRVVLFGGADDFGNVLHDTWEWDGIEWTRTGRDHPPARMNHAMVYDSLRNLTVRFAATHYAGCYITDCLFCSGGHARGRLFGWILATGQQDKRYHQKNERTFHGEPPAHRDSDIIAGTRRTVSPKDHLCVNFTVGAQTIGRVVIVPQRQRMRLISENTVG